MKAFDYVRPATVREAVAAASEPGAAYLASGTNLLDLMKGGVSRLSRLVDRNATHGNHQILDQTKVLDRPAIFVNGPAGAHPTLTSGPFEQVVRIRRPCIHRKTFCDPIPDLPRGALVHVWPSEWRYVGYDGLGAV